MKSEYTVTPQSATEATLSVVVPKLLVSKRLEERYESLRKSANIKGFRVGHAPIAMIKKLYSTDVKQRLLNDLIDSSIQEAALEKKLRIIGNPQILTIGEMTETAGTSQPIDDSKDFKYTAKVELIPEISVSNYKGLKFTKENSEPTQADCDQLLNKILEERSELIPHPSGNDAAASKGEFIDLEFKGGLVTETGVEHQENMKGSRFFELGSNAFIPGFEDQVIGMKIGAEKTFRINFPETYKETSLASKEAEFTVKVLDRKVVKLPELTDEIAKTLGAESVEGLKTLIKNTLTQSKAEEGRKALRKDLLAAIIAANKFEIPKSLIYSQMRMLTKEFANSLTKQGYPEALVKSTVESETPNLLKRAEEQVKASLCLEAVSRQESIKVEENDVREELERMSKEQGHTIEELRNFFFKDQRSSADFLYRALEEKTIRYLLSESKISEK